MFYEFRNKYCHSELRRKHSNGKLKGKNVFVAAVWKPARKLSRKSSVIKEDKLSVILLHLSRIKTNANV